MPIVTVSPRVLAHTLVLVPEFQHQIPASRCRNMLFSSVALLQKGTRVVSFVGFCPVRVVPLIILAMLSPTDAVEPGTICQIPTNGRLNPLFKVYPRLLAQLVLYFGAVESVPLIVTWPILNMPNMPLRLPKKAKDGPDNQQILTRCASRYVVNRIWFGLQQGQFMAWQKSSTSIQSRCCHSPP